MLQRASGPQLRQPTIGIGRGRCASMHPVPHHRDRAQRRHSTCRLSLADHTMVRHTTVRMNAGIPTLIWSWRVFPTGCPVEDVRDLAGVPVDVEVWVEDEPVRHDVDGSSDRHC